MIRSPEQLILEALVFKRMYDLYSVIIPNPNELCEFCGITDMEKGFYMLNAAIAWGEGGGYSIAEIKPTEGIIYSKECRGITYYLYRE